MNIDMIPEGIAPEIDVRLTAMVLGEASDFEAAQLHELMSQRPELAAWYQQLQRLHGELNQWALLEQHLAESTANEKIIEAGPWMLSPEKRASVLAVLGHGKVETPAQITPLTLWQRLSQYHSKRRGLWMAAGVAASLLIVCSALLLPSVQSAREASKRNFEIAASAPASASNPPSTALPNAFYSQDDVKHDPPPTSSANFRNSPPSSLGTTRLYATPNKANDFSQTVTPRIVVTEEAEEQSQVTVPGGGNMLLGDVAGQPTLPPASVIAGKASDSKKLAEADNMSDFATEPGENSLGLYSRPEPQLEQRFDSKDSGVFYFGDEGKSSTPAKPGAPARDGTLDHLQSLADQKPQAEPDMDDPFGEDVPAKRSSSAVAQEKQSLDLAKNQSGEDFGTMLGMSSTGGGMGGLGGSERGRQNSSAPQQTPELLLKESTATHNFNTRWDEANSEVRPDIALMNPDTPLMDKEGRQLGEDLSVVDEEIANLRFRFNKGKELTDESEAGKNETHWYFDSGREKDFVAREFDNSEVGGKRVQLRQQLLEKAQPSPGLNETLVETERFSTFSLHVSDVSFKLALDSLAKGQWPEAAKIRLEEFLNAFDYQDPLPSEEEKVACQVEQATHPFLMQRNVLRVAMRTSAVGRNSSTPLRLTLLLDNSGSMQRGDRAQTVRRAFETLAQQLTPADQVTLITFANEPKLRADRVNGSEILNFVNILENSPVEGGTNLEAALRLALEKSTEAKTAGAQSRVILMTDGAVNLGDADPNNLSQLVLKMRDQGIAFDAAGISAQDLNDEVLEALTRQGDGRYYLLDNAEQVDAGFSQQIAGALRPSAKNVKVQVEFNSQRVRSYKLLGFEKHVLNKEDFRNDKVDAAELAAAEAGVALYHYEFLPDGVGDVGSVSVRFQDMSTGMMVEKRWPIAYEPSTSRLDQARSSLKLATSAVLFAAHLKGEPLGENVDLKVIAEILGSLETPYSNVERVQQLRQMVESARQIAGASSGNR